MKKRIFALVTAVVMMFALAACGGKATLESILSSDEWQAEKKTWSDTLSSTGISLDTVADGNTLVFEYHLPDDEAFNAFGESEGASMADAFLGALETGDFLNVFKQGYGVSLDAVRCTVFKADGTEIYRSEIK